MNIIQHVQDYIILKNKISVFNQLIGLSKISRKLNYHRRSKLSLLSILSWLMVSIFQQRSLYRAEKTKQFTTRTVRNVLNDARINWQRLTCLLAGRIIDYLRRIKTLDGRRKLAFVLDDTLIKRSFSKKTELLAKTYDHDRGKYLKGYRGLTLAITDGNTLLPGNYALMSSENQRNRIGSPARFTDLRTLAGQRRAQGQRKMNLVGIELLKQALDNQITADYVLFDTWFSSPKMFKTVIDLGMVGIGMIKNTVKVHYRYRNKLMSDKAIYQLLRRSQRRQHDKYQYSVIVEAHAGDYTFPLRLVFVTKRGHTNKFLVLASTNPGLTPDKIIQMYGRRWQIEGFFKVAKQYLRLDRSQIQSYDGFCAHFALVMMAYDILAWQQRESVDYHSMGDLFFELNRDLTDITLIEALTQLLVNLVSYVSGKIFIEKKINEFLNEFFDQLPGSFSKLLTA